MHVSTCNSLKTLFTTADSNFSERITLTMDERHWWIAGKIQESLKVGGFDNPTLIEDFMCKPETLDMINEFLQPGGPCRLFFFCDTSESIASSNLRGLKIRPLMHTSAPSIPGSPDLDTTRSRVRSWSVSQSNRPIGVLRTPTSARSMCTSCRLWGGRCQR